MKKKQMMKRKKNKHVQANKSSSNNTAIGTKRKILYLLAIVICAISLGLILTLLKSDRPQIQPGGNYKSPQLDGKMATERFLQLLVALPDENARQNLTDMVSQRGLKVLPDLKKGAMAFNPRQGTLKFNPQIFSQPDGYAWAYMVHENRHIEDWQGKHESGKMYLLCEMENYTSHRCKMEWWDAEFRAVEQQAIFLKNYNLTWTMPTGPKVNNREIFKKYDVRLAALIFLLKNYYEGRSASPDLLEVFPEFYYKKLAEIS